MGGLAALMWAVAAVEVAADDVAAATIAPKGAPSAEKLGWRLGCQAYTFNRFTFFEAVDKTAALGLHYIEAYPGQRLSPAHGDVVLDQNLPAELQQETLAYLKSKGVKLVNFGVVGLGNDEAENRKVFDFAKAMGIETIVSEAPQESFGLLDQLTKEYGIRVAMHNHPQPSRYWDPKVLLAACEGHSERVGSCADTGHWLRSGVVPVDALKLLEGRVISFHLKDLAEFGRKEAHDVVWGTGLLNLRAVLEEMRRQGFQGVFSVEYEHNWDNSLPDIALCVANFEEVCKSILELERKQ
jgi:sugar phosphate isomerase/epimerase